ncbi:DUF4363 family protein [Thermoanaerobacterium sp. RBIITD]|uniref:DUF4363 family protein n=1 Tax=Thermoanaerobacterium sp. RBIITD TaxID=1550240 RepID=UPI001E625CD5|nr:DUF4363 family protein [Thermoanaerobacterium sp. RBIITD]
MIPLIVIIVVFIVLIDISSYKYLDTTSKNIDQKLTYIEKDISNNNWNSAKKHINDLEKIWHETNSKWAILIEHREIDDIDMSLSKLKSFIDTKNKDLSLAELQTLKELYSHIPSNEKLNFENIL